MKEEQFRDIVGYDGVYQVSNLGNVKSLKFSKELLLKKITNKECYLRVNLYKGKEAKSWYVHQLVAEAFLNHTPSGYKLVVNHINFNRTDNRVDNLEIVTPRENTNKKHIKSSSKYTGVYWNKAAKKWHCHISINGKQKYLGLFEFELDAAKTYQMALDNIN